jgi:hypothetical protein
MSHPHDPHKPQVAFDEAPDSWHRHLSEEGQPQEEHGAQADSLALIVSFVGSVFFVGAVIVVCLLYFQVQYTKLRRERIETTALAADYFQYRDDSDKALHGYGWANPEAAAAGKVSGPIDAAMQKVIEQYAARKGARTDGTK